MWSGLISGERSDHPYLLTARTLIPLVLEENMESRNPQVVQADDAPCLEENDSGPVKEGRIQTLGVTAAEETVRDNSVNERLERVAVGQVRRVQEVDMMVMKRARGQ